MKFQRNKNLLMVGLEETTLSVIKNSIDELAEHFQTECAISGTAALEKLSSSFYPIIFVDGFLPDMTGLYLAREIKAINQNIEVILIMPSDLNRFNGMEFAREIDHLLNEPISIAYVQQLVKDSIRRSARLAQMGNAQEEVHLRVAKGTKRLNSALVLVHEE